MHISRAQNNMEAGRRYWDSTGDWTGSRTVSPLTWTETLFELWASQRGKVNDFWLIWIRLINPVLMNIKTLPRVDSSVKHHPAPCGNNSPAPCGNNQDRPLNRGNHTRPPLKQEVSRMFSSDCFVGNRLPLGLFVLFWVKQHQYQTELLQHQLVLVKPDYRRR